MVDWHMVDWMVMAYGRLDGWCEGFLGQQRNDCECCATMRDR